MWLIHKTNSKEASVTYNVMLREIIRTGNTVTEKKLYWTPGE